MRECEECGQAVHDKNKDICDVCDAILNLEH